MNAVAINNIKIAFSKAAKDYDTHAFFQKEVADELIIRLPHLTPHISHLTILDIGCGTGFLAHGLAKTFPKANIFGCDISHAMINVARGKGQGANDKKIYFITGDCGILPCKSKTFDIITSSLTYQWLPNLGKAFSEAHRILKPEGMFIFFTLGAETLKELRCCYAEASAPYPLSFGERERVRGNGLPSFMGFADEQAIQSALKNTGFKHISIERKEIVKTYPDMWQLLKTMKSIGAGNPFKDGDKSLGRGFLLKKMAEIYEQKFGVRSSELGIYATYEVMFVHAEK